MSTESPEIPVAPVTESTVEPETPIPGSATYIPPTTGTGATWVAMVTIFVVVLLLVVGFSQR